MGRYLSKSQPNELLSELRLERERRHADRIRLILLIDEGKCYQKIARFLFPDEKTVSNWKKRYDESGLEKLVNDHYMGRIALLTDDQIEGLHTELESRVYPGTHAIVAFFRDTFGVAYTIGGMTSLIPLSFFQVSESIGVKCKFCSAITFTSCKPDWKIQNSLKSICLDKKLPSGFECFLR